MNNINIVPITNIKELGIMFIKNKYFIWYKSLIRKAQNRIVQENCNYENHHIIPSCLGGSDNSYNKVKLTLREHFIAHKLLTKFQKDGINRKKMFSALHFMWITSKYEIPNSKRYEIARGNWIHYLKSNHPCKRIENWNEMMSKLVTENWKDNDIRRENTSEVLKDYWKNNYEKMLKIANMASKKGAEAIKNKWKNDIEWAAIQRKNSSERSKGEKNGMYGKTHDELWRKNHKEKLLGRKRMNNGYENKMIDPSNFNSYLQNGWKFGSTNKNRKEASDE